MPQALLFVLVLVGCAGDDVETGALETSGRIAVAVIAAALGFFAGAWSGKRRARTLKRDAERAAEGEREDDR